MISIIKKSEFATNIIKMFAGVFLSQIIMVVGSLVLARLYSPEQFGKLSLFISIVSILSILATARYENTIILIKKNFLVKYMFSFLHVSSIIFAFFVLIILLLINTSTLIYMSINEFYLLIPTTILTYSFFQISTNYNVREKNFSVIAKSKIIMAIVALLTQVILTNYSLGLLYGYTLGYFVALLVLYKNIPDSWIPSFNKKRIAFLLNKYSYFVKHALLADFINNLAINITPILIAMWFDMKVAGLYFLGYRIINLPLQLISASVGKVYFQKVSIMYSENNKELYRFTKKIIIILFTMIVFPLVILFFYAQEILQFILGENWKEAGVYISLLTIMFFFRTLFSPISSIAEVTKKIYIVLFFSIYVLVVIISSLYIGHIYNDFYMAVMLLSISVACGYLYLLIYFMLYLKGLKHGI